MTPICHTCHTFNTTHTCLRCHERMSKNKFSRRAGRGSAKDTNPLAYRLVVSGRERVGKRNPQAEETKVTRGNSDGVNAELNCRRSICRPCRDSGQSIATHPALKRWAMIYRPCRDSWKFFFAHMHRLSGSPPDKRSKRARLSGCRPAMARASPARPDRRLSPHLQAAALLRWRRGSRSIAASSTRPESLRPTRCDGAASSTRG